MSADVIILILAAGASSRMRGEDKLLLKADGEALLRRQARIALETGCPVIVTLPPDRPLRQVALEGLPVAPVIVPDARGGMSASLRRGLAGARRIAGPQTGLMILPADMPEFTAEALNAILTAFAAEPDCIQRGMAADGQPGHPAIFPRDLWDALDRVRGDQGGRQVLTDHAARIRQFPLPGRMALTDLDTPEDWAAWRAGRLPGGG